MTKFTMSWYSLLLALIFTSGAANASLVTYNYVITGDVVVGDSGTYGLNNGDTITATGTFTADLTGGATVSFGSGSGNTMTIDLNGTLLTASQDVSYAGGSYPYLTFDNTMALTDFDYQKTTSPAFESSFTSFDDFGNLYGNWRTSVSLSTVPLPAGILLFGSGLLGLVGVGSRKR